MGIVNEYGAGGFCFRLPRAGREVASRRGQSPNGGGENEANEAPGKFRTWQLECSVEVRERPGWIADCTYEG